MKFDVAVIGGGPAGLSSGIFTSRAGLNTICFEKLAIGGQAALSYEIKNYPAFKSISGFELTQNMFMQAKDCGVNFVFENIKSVNKTKTGFSLKTKTNSYFAKQLIIACGTVSRKLGLDEDRFIGKGVSYCASCDGNFFKNKVVAVVGGGDSAFSYCEYLSRIVKKVYLINRSDRFKASKARINAVKQLNNVEILTNTQVTQLNGKDVLESILLSNKKELKTDGLFVAIGHVPNLDFINFDMQLDDHGYIIVDQYMKTSQEGVYACGDIVSKHFRQVVTACAEGAIAGNSCVGV